MKNPFTTGSISCASVLRLFFPLIAFILLPSVLVGCGGSSNNSPSAPTSRALGNASLTIVWPAQPKAGSGVQPALIPAATNSIKVVLTSTTNSKITFSQTVNRPTTGNTTSTTFNVPGDTYTVTATAYPQAAGVGTALAAGTGSITISVGQTANMTVTMNSTIATLKITPGAPSVAVGATTTLAVAGYDASGAMVLLTPSKLTWTSSAASVATVNGSGVVTGGKAGSATITVTDSESKKSATVTTTVTASSGGGGSGKPFYTITDLRPIAGSTLSEAYAISNAGLVVGVSGTSSDHAVLWQNGQTIDLGIPQGYTSTDAFGVNDAGQVVGFASSPTKRDPFLWTKDKGFIILPKVNSGSSAVAVGINNSSEVFVTEAYGGSIELVAYSSSLFQYSNGKVTYIASTGPDGSAINASGLIAGTGIGLYRSQACRIDVKNNTVVSIGTPVSSGSTGTGINSLGQVVGYADTGQQTQNGYHIFHALFWDPKIGIKDLGTLGGDDSRAAGINSSGQIIGTAEDSSGNEPSFVYSGGKMYDLGTLLDAGSSAGWSSEIVTAINDKGQICGYGTYNGQTDAFLLTPKQ